jgi:hypothetical protein
MLDVGVALLLPFLGSNKTLLIIKKKENQRRMHASLALPLPMQWPVAGFASSKA